MEISEEIYLMLTFLGHYWKCVIYLWWLQLQLSSFNSRA